MENEYHFSFEVYGDYALFSDPITKIGGEKLTYQVPTYQALKGITESIYWKPTITYHIDKVRIMNQIKEEAKGILLTKFTNNAHDLARYTYLRDVRYQVAGHFTFNLNRSDLAADRNVKKHAAILKRSIERGGRRDIFLGTRECQGYVEPCEFGSGAGFYDNQTDERYFGVMVHGIDYPDEIGKDELRIRLWKPSMKQGIISFNQPDEFPNSEKDLYLKKVRKMQAKEFSKDNVASVDETYQDIFGGDNE